MALIVIGRRAAEAMVAGKPARKAGPTPAFTQQAPGGGEQEEDFASLTRRRGVLGVNEVAKEWKHYTRIIERTPTSTRMSETRPHPPAAHRAGPSSKRLEKRSRRRST